MTFLRLLRLNLRYHRRGNFAVLLGVALGAAVLTGALLVGDSLRGSLQERAEQQRCGVDYAMVSGRWFSRDVLGPGFNHESGLVLRGALEVSDNGQNATLQNVTLFAGPDPRLLAATLATDHEWDLARDRKTIRMTRNATSQTVAKKLGLSPRHIVRFRYSTSSTISRDSLLGQRDFDKAQDYFNLGTDLEILPDDDPISRFRLVPGAEVPRNVYTPIWHLGPWREAGPPAKINALLVRGSNPGALQAALKKNLTLDDWGVSITKRPNYVAIESKQTLLEPAVISAVERATKGMRSAPTLVYLANTIAADDKKEIPYSVIAALDPTAPAPLGPFLPPGVTSLADDEIVLADWQDSPLRGLVPGSPITLTFFEPETKDGRLVEAKATFKLRGYVPMTGPAADPSLTPPFPGITDKLSLRQWNPPFPYDNTRMKAADERYWRDHKTTPKAYVTLAAGQKLWSSRFGNLTSVRLPPDTNVDEFKAKLLAELNPEEGGFVFEDIKARFEAASKGGQDFGGLFLGFSFFLIASALLLVGLLTRLNLERRASEIGLLLATGWRIGKVRRLLLLESVIVATVGALLGLVGAIAYAWAMLKLLAALWPDASVRSFLQLHIAPESLAIGFVGTLAISSATILWALRMLKRVSPSALIAGSTTPAAEVKAGRGRGLVGIVALVVIAILGISAIGAGSFQANPAFRAMGFFAGGALLLTAALMTVWRWLKYSQATFTHSGPSALLRLGASNARRYPARSLLTAGLLASAAFLLVAVESFRRQPEKDFSRRDGGSGGFALIVETDLPVFRDLNSEGRNDLLDTIDRQLQSLPEDPAESLQQRKDKARELIQATKVYPFRLRAGDDASCLNLYQAGRPRLLGVPQSFADEDSRFRFVDSEARTAEEKANPWRLLFSPRDDGAIPVFGEENTLMWMLKKGLGEEVEVPDETGKPAKLRIVGVLKDSVFPSELLMSAPAFQKLYPRTEGYSFFLAETPAGQADAASNLLRIGLAKQGPEITPTQQRVAAYLAVENTYLTTFQLLGGLGLLLGALGLAVVLLRGVWERRSELALLRALGYRNRALGGLVLAENGLLLLLGLTAGVGAALLSVLPHLAAGNPVPWPRLTLLLALVVLAGFLAGLWAVRTTLRAPLLPALRKE